MKLRIPHISLKWIWASVVVLVIGIALFSKDRWIPISEHWITATIAAFKDQPSGEGEGESSQDATARVSSSKPASASLL